jgi:hypothetical protein
VKKWQQEGNAENDFGDEKLIRQRHRKWGNEMGAKKKEMKGEMGAMFC